MYVSLKVHIHQNETKKQNEKYNGASQKYGTDNAQLKAIIMYFEGKKFIRRGNDDTISQFFFFLHIYAKK